MKKIVYSLVLVSIISTGCVINNNEQTLGANYDQNSQWFYYNSFSGYKTKLDPSKLADGDNPQGQNTSIFDGDRIGVRQLGYEVFPEGEATTSTSSIKSLHTFRRRDGSNILMRSYGTVLEFFDENTDSWSAIKTGFTSGLKFGYADYNINTDLHSYVYFGNGVESFMRWNGAHTNLTANVTTSDTVVNVSDTTGFRTTGDVYFCGVSTSYSSITPTTITLTASSSVNCAASSSVTQSVDVYASNPRGNIYLNANNRLFIAGISSTSQAVYFSEYGVATNFVGATLVTNSTATSPGIFNLGEGGGAVTGMVLEEKSIYILKKSIVYTATLSDSLYVLQPLKPFDGKSQTVGATHNLSTFTGGNGVFFVTPNNQILNLERIDGIDYPQVTAISDQIKPTTDVMNFSESTGITFKDKAYFSQKTNNDSTTNDVVLVWNTKNQAWDSPVVGWNVSDFAIYDNGSGEELYFGSSNSANVYKVINKPLDDIYEVKANWRSRQYDFGSPYSLKEINDFYVEGYISPNTTLKMSLLLDEDGYTQIVSSDFYGTESDFIYNSSEYNAFGLTQFGTKRFGSNDDNSGAKKFRVYFSKGLRLNPFYNAQLEFASEGENANWEITGYGFLVRQNSQAQKRTLIRELK